MRPCEHDKVNFVKRFIFKIRHVFLVKETLRPFVLVMAYFFFNSMSGFIPIRPNMVNFCSALGVKYDPKAVVVSIQYLCFSLLNNVNVRCAMDLN